MPRRSRQPLFAASAVFALLLACLPAFAATQELERLQDAYADLKQELHDSDQAIRLARERLSRAESGIAVADITTRLLEDARLDLASLQSRESGLKTRLVARQEMLERLRERAVNIRQSLQEDGIDDAAQDQLKAELAAIAEQREVLDKLIDTLEELKNRFHTRLLLSRQRLNMLQARFELPDLASSHHKLGAQGRALQAEIDALLLESSTARRLAAAITGDSPAEQAKRRLHELQSMAAEEQAELAQLAITRLRAKRVLDSLSTFSGSRVTPVRVIKQALGNLAQLEAELTAQREHLADKARQFQSQSQIIRQQGQIASGSDSTLSQRLSLIDGLDEAVRADTASLDQLLARIEKSSVSYRSDLSINASAELMVSRQLPTDRESVQQLLANLASLPLRVLVVAKHAVVNFITAIGLSTVGTRMALIATLLAISLVAVQVRRVIGGQLRAVHHHDGDTADALAPLQILYNNIFTLLPPVMLIAAGWLLEVRKSDIELLAAPLLIYPAIRFSHAFINELLDDYTPGLDQRQTHALMLETRWVVLLGALLAAAIIAAKSVALSPLVIDIIDRFAMLCLLLIALPLLHLRRLLLKGMSGTLESTLIRHATLWLPIVLAICAVVGLVGYVNLARAIATRVGWLFVVAIAFHFAREVLIALFASAQRWFQRRNAESAEDWNNYILGPLYRVCVLILLVVAAQLLFHLYEWNMQTPIVRHVPLLLDSSLFTVGTTTIKLKTLALALLALFVAIWGGGWSRKVSYRWVYTGVSDQGIRNSLSTFTQYFVVVLGLVVAMKIIGLDLTALTVFAGALGVGIGFGMQQIVVNFISGILLLVERPLATTDLVNVDQYEGEVTRIGIRSLTVKTFDNQEVIIPNSAVITKPFTNWTRGDDVMRTLLLVGISYDDDPHRAVAIIEELVSSHPAILDSPAPKVLLWEYGDSALIIRIQFHSRIRGEVGRADLRSQLLFLIWDHFKEAGITIPYPQRDVHIHSAPE